MTPSLSAMQDKLDTIWHQMQPVERDFIFAVLCFGIFGKDIPHDTSPGSFSDALRDDAEIMGNLYKIIIAATVKNPHTFPHLAKLLGVK